jgi:hypothetical protein
MLLARLLSLPQIETDYTKSDYDRYLAAIYQYSSQQLFDMGKIFSK